LSGWDLSCKDWEARLQAGQSLVPSSLPIDEFAGARAVAVFNKLRLADVPGTPTMGEAAGDWFRDIVRALFGSLDPKTRERAIRELFLLVPKKNSKTTNGALLMLTALLLNERPNASFIMTAPVQDVAELAFSAAAGAIKLDPVLAAKFHVRDHLKTITHRQTNAELQIMTFDPAVVTGQKISGGALIDELHVIAKMGKAASAVRQMRGGMLPFPEAFLAFITTQSEEPPSGVFGAELEKARAIRDGRQQGAMLPVLYELPEAIQKDPVRWRDPANWAMVTPNAGRSISIPRLVEDMRTAEQTSQEELIAWASQHINLQIGLSLHGGRWAGADFWEDAANATLPDRSLAAMLARCEVAVVGIDGGGLDDLLGVAVLGRERETRRWLLWAHAWAHPIVLQRRGEIAAQLLDFQRDGDLTLVERVGQDVEEVADICCQVRESGLLPDENAIGVDAVGIGDIVDALFDPARKFDEKQIVAISQGWKLNAAIKTTERKVAGGELLHSGSRLMAWSVGNARTNMVGNAISVTKQRSGSAKIDPLMATFDAISLMAMNPAARKQGVSFFFM
jgi:phage terminase large subunit-like protein